MWKRLVVLLLLIPLVDALFLVVVADFLGWQVTVLLVVLTALVGMLSVRAEGRHTIRRLQRALVEGRAPTDPLVDGGLLIAAGAFLLTPGLVTDAIGFLLVIPPTRYVVRAAMKRWLIVPYLDRKTGGFATGEVYTFGFPDAEARAGASEAAAADRDVTDGGTIDLGREEYDVEDGDEK